MPFDGNTKHIGTMYSWDAVRARIRAEAEAVGKAEFVLDAELIDEGGTVVANSHGVYQLRRFGT